ncbi:MAG: Holliday junction branch migration DNA helicase RuvB [Candidatus Bipolaricaulota bacterium]
MSEENSTDRGPLDGQRRRDESNATILRPTSLEDFTGQEDVKKRLSILLEAARQRGTTVDHILFHGPPGLGKTTLANIVSHEMEVNIKTSSGPAIEKPGDLAAIVSNLAPGDIFFIDEIHRLRRNVEEVLYPAMEDFKIDIVVGEGPSAQSIRLDVPPFTLIGATTRTGLLTSPLRDRFEVVLHLDFYEESAIREIILRGADLLDVEISDDGAAREIAKRSRGTPRIANRLLKRARDYAQVRGDGYIDQEVARKALEMLGIDEAGLDKLDRQILKTIVEKFNGGPVGLETLAAALSEEKDTVSEVYEPFLLKKGFLERTSQGRKATPKSVRHLGYEENKLL